jgi:hypothetical protein
MARRKSGRGGRRSGGGGGGRDLDAEAGALALALGEVADPLLAVGAGLKTAGEALGGFAKGLVTGTEEWQRASAAVDQLTSSLTAPAIQGLAGAIAPGAGAFVGKARGALGEVAALGAAESELENFAAGAAAQGVPLDKNFLRSLVDPLIERQGSIQKGRQSAQDAFADRAFDHEVEHNTSVGKAYEGFMKIGLAEQMGLQMAQKFVDEMRSRMPILFGGSGR